MSIGRTIFKNPLDKVDGARDAHFFEGKDGRADTERR
jgi:hypothetical protein